VIAGSCVSFTVTSKLQTSVFPELSVTVQVTVVVPKLNETPSNEVPVPVVAPVNTYVNEETVQLSVAVASHPVPV